MSLFEYFIIYIVIWWIAFFISLPMGVKKPENIEIGDDEVKIFLLQINKNNGEKKINEIQKITEKKKYILIN